MIPQIEPDYGEEEIRAVTRYMNGGGWLTEHTETHAFESELAAFIGAKHCIVTTSGTTGLVAMLLAAGIRPGDEVIVPDLTMMASASAVQTVGAIPVLVDVEPETLCAGADQVSNALSDRTKAVLSVSLNGRSAAMAALEDLCRRKDLVFLEDAAQSMASKSCGRYLGTFGRAGVCSFSPHKIITTGQGGAIVTDDDGIAERARMIKDFGRREPGIDVHEVIGYNFKFTDLQAVVGREQLKKLEARIARKRSMFARYREQLKGVVRFVETNLVETTPWFIDILVDDREALKVHLTAQGIGSRSLYPPVHAQPATAGASRREGSFPVAERVSSEGLWLPSSLKLTDDQIDRVCSTIRRFYGEAS